MSTTSDDDIRKLWREAGGAFHGPKVETGYMTEARLLEFLRGLLGKTILAEAQAAGAMSMLAEVRDECVTMRKLARRLSSALLTVRPLGGSELFTSVGDDFYADPDTCRTEIEKLRSDLHTARCNEVRAIRLAAAKGAPTQSAEAVACLEDKIDGLEADLESAVEVAFRRGAIEWTRLNYPTIYARLISAPSPDVSELAADLSPEVEVMPLAFGKSREWFERKAQEESDADPTTGVPAPSPGSIWKHHSGREYRVLFIANAVPDPRPDYPPTVVYQGIENGKRWAGRLDDWHRRMTPSNGRTE